MCCSERRYQVTSTIITLLLLLMDTSIFRAFVPVCDALFELGNDDPFQSPHLKNMSISEYDFGSYIKNPVCASNLVTYANFKTFEIAKKIQPEIEILHHGKCEPPTISLDDILICVRTSKKFEKTRLPIILKTWYQLARDQTWFLTDAIPTDYALYNKTSIINTFYNKRFKKYHIIDTQCSDSHSIKDLCCKTSVEFDFFINSFKKWLCHFDDDNYVNVPRLVEVLRKYNYHQDWYLGATSLLPPKQSQKNIFIQVATFAAGMCLSRSLALKIVPVAGGGKFRKLCDKIHQPDFVTMGYIVELLGKRKLTVLREFHSHVEKMSIIPQDNFRNQISFSYSKDNVIEVPGFNVTYDPSRFLSLHCFLFPHFKICQSSPGFKS